MGHFITAIPSVCVHMLTLTKSGQDLTVDGVFYVHWSACVCKQKPHLENATPHYQRGSAYKLSASGPD